MVRSQLLVVATEAREALTIANVRRVRLGVYGLSGWSSKRCYMSRFVLEIHAFEFFFNVTAGVAHSVRYENLCDWATLPTRNTLRDLWTRAA
jgi:hypothetical protein